MDEQGLSEAIHWVVLAIEITGMAIIVIGVIAALTFFLRHLAGTSDKREKAIGDLRSDLGRAILLGLEFLVAADIINTIVIEPTLESAAVLGAIVLIRTFLSFSLEVEIEGRWPWRRGESTARTSQPG